MKKSVILLSLLLCSIILYAAEGDTLGRQVKHIFVTDQWGHTKWGLYRKPLSPGPHPVIAFFHGAGEYGTTEAHLSKLLTHGTPWLISQGTNLVFTNPANGVQSEFISIAIQNPGWSAEPADVLYALQNDPLIAPYVNWSGIFFTGLSAGGQMTLQAVTTSPQWSSLITAIVPMSSASPGFSAGYQYWQGRPTWAFHGLQDNTCPYAYTQTFINACGGIWTQLPTGHGNWNSIYNGQYRQTINGYSVNIYEWMLMQMNGVLSIPAPQQNNTPPVHQFYYSNQKIHFKSSRFGAFFIYDALNRIIKTGYYKPGINNIETTHLKPGVYIFNTNFKTFKFLHL